MKILIACEFSGIVREAFRKRGHDAWSCDLLPSDDNSPFHIQGDVLEILDHGWDMMIAHPPCTYLTCSAEWAYKDVQTKNIKPGTLIGHARRLARDQATDFFMRLANANVDRICLENPVGVMSTRWCKPDQYIQPNQFGDDASKNTGLWLKNLTRLVVDPAQRIQGRIVDGKERWANQTDSGQNRLGPSANRWQLRSATYPGIAKAMAKQWGTK